MCDSTVTENKWKGSGLLGLNASATATTISMNIDDINEVSISLVEETGAPRKNIFVLNVADRS